ncbi:MAG TPA: molecular chaperone [Rhodospirillaceae bacterium]|nr:MAG: molecular chaperone [Rhodospirillaceae bacterium TMED63]RZO35368.1 MAG: Hsp20 family protein [Rhodospirillaceae bacterium]HCH57595.1 molecular chaperone [Rhodospirillaceae bacterium]|tara:strand:- start:5424 stop:5882 length:459 start_codon:yes stop_codon:yes gene_type:complete
MRTFDFSPLYRSAVGFDRLMNVLDAAQKNGAADGYPPYNIEKTSEDSYQITLAVAGFGSADLDVEVRDGQLVIVGKGDSEEQDNQFLHRGIARRAFERRFQLADHVEVKAADLVDGLLKVDLVREIPEAMKPRKIDIRTGGTIIEDQSAKAA